MGGGLGQTLATGMAFGAGSAVAHQVVGSMMGGGGHGNGGGQGGQQQMEGGQQQQMAPAQGGGEYQQEAYQQQEQPCQGFNMNFVNCLKQSSSEIGMCQEYMNMLQQCERDQSMAGQGMQ